MWQLTDAQKLNVVVRYVGGESASAIALDFGVSNVAVLGIVRRRGVATRTNRQSHVRHNLNHGAFSEATEEALYWAGFLMADGAIVYNHGTPTVALVLSEQDRRHVEEFRDFLGAGHAITRIHTPPSAPSYRFSVRSEQLCADLAAFGVLPRKTWSAAADGEAVTSRHFWRGVVDGDGWLRIVDMPSYFNRHPKVNAWSKPRAQARLELVGPHGLLDQFLGFVRSVAPRCEATVRPHKSIFRVGISGCVAEDVVQLLYHDCSVALPRKLDAALNILSRSRNRPPSAGTLFDHAEAATMADQA